jgi:hypothetical protein
MLRDEVHHGDCVGADATCDELCEARGLPRVAHPGTDAAGHSPQRANCDAETVRAPKPYLVRNRDIVDETEWLIACPEGQEVRRSGTWATVRYARKRGRAVVYVWPSGWVER